MSKRLQLIWLALTAPEEALEERIAPITWIIDMEYAEQVQKRLNRINKHFWVLRGVSVEHTVDGLDTWPIQRFLEDAPGIIQRLLDMLQPDEDAWNQWAADVLAESEGH